MNATTAKSRRNWPSLSTPFRQALNEWDCVGLSVSPDTRSYPGNVQLIFQSPGMSLIDPEQRADRSGISAPAGDQRGDCLAHDGAPLGQAAMPAAVRQQCRPRASRHQCGDRYRPPGIVGKDLIAGLLEKGMDACRVWGI